METIVATTDFSPDSRAGLRYAIRMAQTRQTNIAFVHVHQVLKASSWSEEEYRYYIEKSRKVFTKELSAFIRSIYKSASVPLPDKITVKVHHNLDTVAGILECADMLRATYICVSSHGAGSAETIFGIVAGRLIHSSPIPVLCIPHAYRNKPLTNIIYATDTGSYEAELSKVVAFAKPLQAEVEMLHLYSEGDTVPEPAAISESLSRKMSYPVHFQCEASRHEQPVIDELEEIIRKRNPSLLVMFTRQQRTLLDRIVHPGHTSRFSRALRIPLLIFPKPVKGV